jgi:hypothetical protein
VSSEHEETVPGVTLHFGSAQYAGTVEGRLHVKVELDAWVHDQRIWDEVEAKLREGMRIYTVPDFHIEVMDVLRSRLKEAQEKNVLLERQLAQEKDAREQAQAEHDKLRGTLSSFGAALRR